MKRLAVVASLLIASACTSTPAAPAAPSVAMKPVVAEPSAADVSAVKAAIEAKDPEAKKKALAALDGLAVPADPVLRMKTIRAALARPKKDGDLASVEGFGEPPLEGIVATPEGYDNQESYPTILSFMAYCADARFSLSPFATPKNVWSEMVKAHGPLKEDEPPLEKPSLAMPWEDGIVVAPKLDEIDEFDEKTYGPVRARVMAALAKANRDYAVDPDRVVAVGYSLGATVAYDMATRHPDRFCAVGDVSGGCPRHPTAMQNLQTLKVYIMHGDSDDTVPFNLAQANHALMDAVPLNAPKKEAVAAITSDFAPLLKTQVPIDHVFDVVKGGGHSLPQTAQLSARIVQWLHDQRRDPWPRELDLLFPASDKNYRIFWVELPPCEKNRRVIAKVKDNVITLYLLAFPKGQIKLALHLGEPLVDLDKEVVVMVNGTERFRGKVERSYRTLVSDLETDGWDTPRAAPARLILRLGH